MCVCVCVCVCVRRIWIQRVTHIRIYSKTLPYIIVSVLFRLKLINKWSFLQLSRCLCTILAFSPIFTIPQISFQKDVYKHIECAVSWSMYNSCPVRHMYLRDATRKWKLMRVFMPSFFDMYEKSVTRKMSDEKRLFSRNISSFRVAPQTKT